MIFVVIRIKLLQELRKEFQLGLLFPKVIFPRLKLCFLNLFLFFAIHLSLLLAVITSTLSENGRPLQVLHFDSEKPKQNHDYFGKEYTMLPNEPLMATVVLYLSNASYGGQILFPESEVRKKQH